MDTKPIKEKTVVAIVQDKKTFAGIDDPEFIEEFTKELQRGLFHRDGSARLSLDGQ